VIFSININSGVALSNGWVVLACNLPFALLYFDQLSQMICYLIAVS
jgi:hypothetical protein